MERFLSRVVFATAASIAALIFVAVAVGFLGGALYLWLVSQPLAPPLAALIVGAAGLGVAALIMLGIRMVSARRQTAQVPPSRASGTEAAGELGQLIAQEVISLVNAHPYRAIVVSLIAGFTTGASPELRRIFKRSLKE